MYKDYLDDIVKYYRIHDNNAILPQRMLQPSPGNIQKECLLAFRSRLKKSDFNILKEFLESEGDEETVFRTIKNLDRDKFKPLSNFLTKRSNSTKYLNLELLAFLIDFPNRPYKKEDYAAALHGTSGNANILPEETEQHQIYNEENLSNENNPGKIENKVVKQMDFFNFFTSGKIQKRAYILIGVLLPLLVVLCLFIYENLVSPVFKSGEEKCMIWTGDHFIPSSCEPRGGDTVVVAFDPVRVKNFQRIKRPDTITPASENKIWYIKRNGAIEYYTAGGRHPVDHNRVLKPLSRYMILRYQNSPQ